MEYEITHDPAYSMLQTRLNSGEELVAEADAMVSMDPEIKHDTQMTGGFISAILRMLLGGESAFQNKFTGPGALNFSPTLPGKIVHQKLSKESLILQSTAYLVSSPDINLRTQWGGWRSVLGGEGLFLLKAEGTGDLFFNAYGEITEIDVDGTYTLDTGHMVAFDPSLNWSMKTSGGMKSTLFSGEGLVYEFEGQGKLYLQTRHLNALVDWVTPYLPD